MLAPSGTKVTLVAIAGLTGKCYDRSHMSIPQGRDLKEAKTIPATVLKTLFKVKSGVQLFREKRVAVEEEMRNKLGFTVKSKVTVLQGAQMNKTADLAALLDGGLNSQIEALGYSDFIIKWQNYFDDLPYLVLLQPYRKDLRDTSEQGEFTDHQKLDAILHAKVHHAQIEKGETGFTIRRTLGVATNDKGKLTCSIWKTQENIGVNGAYKLDLVEKLFEMTVPNSTWENLPRWFGKR